MSEEAPTRQSTTCLESILQELDPLPHGVAWLLDLLKNPTAGVRRLKRHIETDTQLASFLIHLCQSPYYARSRKVTRIEDALVMLGNRKLAQFAFSVEMARMMRQQLKSYGIERNALWLHSLGVGYGAAFLAAETGRRDLREDAFCAGYLHDIGRPVVAMCLEGRARKGVLVSESGATTTLERNLAGFDHTEAGAALARRWGLPDDMSMTIKFHHAPADAPVNQEVVWAVHAADRVYEATRTDLRVPQESLERVAAACRDHFPLALLRKLAGDIHHRSDRLERLTRGVL